MIIMIVLSVLLICIPVVCNVTDYDCKGINQGADRLWALVMILGIVGLIITALTAMRNSAMGKFIFVMTYWLMIGWWGYPSLNKIKSERYIMEETALIIGPAAELGFVAWRDAFMLYADRSIKEFGFSKPIEEQSKAAKEWLAQKNNRWLLTRKPIIDCCFNINNAIYVGSHERRDWYLINSP